ncbi:MAG: hypothetical protein U0L98_03385 [Clostridia bacterium]|nr:hypothetical protein [Clostridia bacterium]
MAENNENKINTEELKSEASNTVNQVKDTIKKVDIKKDSVETKGFIVELFKNPLEKIKAVAEDTKGNYLKYAIIVLVIWVAAKFLSRCFSIGWHWRPYNIFDNIWSIGVATITPLLSVLVMVLIAFVLNKKNKKPLTTLISAITIANIPTVVASVLSLLTIISSQVSLITIPFTSLCSVISIVLTYFALKNVFGEEKNSDFIRKFVLIETLYYVAYIVLSLLKIYI